MQIEAEQKVQPVTRIEALAALWRVKLWLGQYPIRILWTEAEQPPVSERQQMLAGCSDSGSSGEEAPRKSFMPER